MTKKDYVLIANAIKDAQVSCNLNEMQKETLVNEFCYHLEKTNPRFDGVKFKQAVNGINK